MKLRIDFINFLIQKKLAKLASSLILKKETRKNFHRNAMVFVAKRYLKKYLYAINFLNGEKGGQIPKIIWVCWLQGLENSPNLIQACIKSIKKHSKDYEIKLITNENFREFVDIPKHIIEKKASGNISNTHFSDILRVFLLSQHGGIWVDATVFLTDKLPNEITENSFFCLHTSPDNIITNVNWIIASSKNHILTNAIKELLVEYWRNENSAIHYFIFQILFDLMVENNQSLGNLWQNVPVLYGRDYYNLPFCKELNAKNTFHKLNHRSHYSQDLLDRMLF